MADSDAITFCMSSGIWQISEIKRSQLLNEFDLNLILTVQFYFYGQNSIINEPEFNLIKEIFWKFHHWSHRWFCNKSWETDKKGPKWTTTVKTKHQRIRDSWTIWVQIEFLILKSALWPINNLTPITIWIKFDIIKNMFTWKLILDGVKNLVMTLSNKASLCFSMVLGCDRFYTTSSAGGTYWFVAQNRPPLTAINQHVHWNQNKFGFSERKQLILTLWNS